MPLLTQTELRSMPITEQPPQTARATSPLATYDLQSLPAEPPKTGAATQIQLHLSGNDDAAASIRVTDRNGAVNVSVHASDPLLRNSLRSNITELSGQLSTQGWKAELRTPAMAHPNGGTSDAGADGRNASNQQPKFAQGERQTPRDRRGNGSDWRDEIEEQIAGNNNPGGQHS